MRALTLIAVLAAMFANASSVAADEWQAGLAKENITPKQLMWMSGYGSRNKPAEGKLTDLWAKVLVLEDGKGHRGVVITLDLVGIDRQLTKRITDRIERDHKITREQVAICTSHTHTGPVVNRNLSPLHYLVIEPTQQKLVDQYARRLEDQVVSVVGRAIKNLAPAKLSWGNGTATFAVNRRNNSESKVPQLRADGNLKGPYDHDVPVLAIHANDGKLRGVLFGYACHATVLSFYQWSGDYPGFAQIEVERLHPGCQAMFWAGCGADQNPLPRRKVEQAKSYGQRLAQAVHQVLVGSRESLGPSLRTSYREIDLPLGDLPARDKLIEDTRSSNKWVVARAKMLLEQLDKQGKLAKTYPYPVAVWQIGNRQQAGGSSKGGSSKTSSSKDAAQKDGRVNWVILGGEVVVDYAVRFKNGGQDKRTWVAGYSNDVMAYIPSRRVLREGGYEGGTSMVYYGLPTIWAPALEDMIHETAAALGHSGE